MSSVETKVDLAEFRAKDELAVVNNVYRKFKGRGGYSDLQSPDDVADLLKFEGSSEKQITDSWIMALDEAELNLAGSFSEDECDSYRRQLIEMLMAPEGIGYYDQITEKIAAGRGDLADLELVVNELNPVVAQRKLLQVPLSRPQDLRTVAARRRYKESCQESLLKGYEVMGILEENIPYKDRESDIAYVEAAVLFAECELAHRINPRAMRLGTVPALRAQRLKRTFVTFKTPKTFKKLLVKDPYTLAVIEHAEEVMTAYDELVPPIDRQIFDLGNKAVGKAIDLAKFAKDKL